MGSKQPKTSAKDYQDIGVQIQFGAKSVLLDQCEQIMPTCKGCELVPQASHPSPLSHSAVCTHTTRSLGSQMCHLKFVHELKVAVEKCRDDFRLLDLCFSPLVGETKGSGQEELATCQ